MRTPRRTVPRSRVVGALVPVVATLWLGVASPAGASSPSSVALRIATYAVASASHERPAHVVTPGDVANAASINTINTSGLVLTFNVGDVIDYPRLALFTDPTSFRNVCLDFPASVGGAPTATACPREALALWSGRAGALSASNRAIAAAAGVGRAVSGADVVAAAAIYHLTLVQRPTFRAGQGGTVTFRTLLVMGSGAKVRVNNCVKFPKTAYGLPTEVRC